MKIKPAIILAQPQMGENIGAIARIMANFSLVDLRIVNPRDGWPNRKASIMALGGKGVLDNAKIFDNIEDAIAGLESIFACSARVRKMHKDHYNLKEHIDDIRESYAEDSKVGIMFGSERCGLLNEEIIHAKKIINIIGNPDYSVLNLSHAVGLIAYEYFNLADLGGVASKYKKKNIDAEELSFFLQDLQEKLEKSGYFKDKDRQVKLFQNISNIFSRNDLSSQEVKSLIGINKSLYNFEEKAK